MDLIYTIYKDWSKYIHALHENEKRVLPSKMKISSRKLVTNIIKRKIKYLIENMVYDLTNIYNMAV